MFIYGKTATNAIAVMSYLAAKAPQRVGSAVIAKARNISPVLTAKLLSQLASAGFLSGQPGPGGGYTLVKNAAEIRLIDIVSLFEQIDDSSRCPFGSDWCGNEDPCPLHDTITDMIASNRRYMEETRLSVFNEMAVTPKRQRPRSKKTATRTSGKSRARRPGHKSI